MKKLTVKKILSIMLAFCIMLSTFAVLASAQCAGHTDADSDTLCDGCGAQLVAKMTKGETVTYFDDICDVNYNSNGETYRVDLLADCVANIRITFYGNATLYLNGYHIDRSETLAMDETIAVASGAQLTIEAGDTTWEIKKVNGSAYAKFLSCREGSKLTINGGNFVGIQGYVSMFLFGYGDVALNNTKISGYFSSEKSAIESYGKLTLNNVVLDTGLTGLNLRNNSATSTIINGGQYSAIYRDILSTEDVQTATDNLLYSIPGDGYFFYKTSTGEQITEATEKNGQVRILGTTVTKAVADVNNTAFTSFDSALAYAQTLESATLKLYEDVTHATPMTLTGGNITFDLNGHNITYTGTSSPSWDVQAGNHKVINGGAIKVGKHSYKVQIADGAELKIVKAHLPDGLGVTSGQNVLGLLAYGSYFKGAKGWTNSNNLQHVGAMATNEYLWIMPLQFTDIPAEYSVPADGHAIFNYEITDPTILHSRYDWYIDGELVLEDGSSGISVSEFSVGTYRIQCVARSTQDESNPDALTFKSTVCVLNVLPCDTHLDNGDDSYCDVCNTQLEAKVTIGDVNTWYENVKDAFAAANGNTATVKLLKDSSIGSSTIELKSGDINLDLNGFMIQSPNRSLITLRDSVKLTVDATGVKYEFDYETNLELFTVYGGTLEVNGGEFTATDGRRARSVVNNNGGNVILNNVTIAGKTSSGLLYHYSGTSVLNNCHFTAPDEKAVYLYAYGSIEINGGYYSSIYDIIKFGDKTALDLIGEGYYAADNDTKEEIPEYKTVEANDIIPYDSTVIENVLVVPENHTCQYVDGFCIYCNSYEQPEFYYDNHFWAEGYHIYNLGQYYWFAENVTNGTIPNTSQAFILANIGTAEKPITKMIGSMETPFCGRIYGGDKTLTVNIISDTPAGIVSVAGDEATINDIIINGAVESTGEYAGSVIGYVTDAIPMTRGVTVTYSINNATVKATKSAGGFIGGGVTLYTYMEECFNYGTVTANEHCGGLIGYYESTTDDSVTIDKCLNYGEISCPSSGMAGGFIGKAVGTANVSYCGNLGKIYSASGFAGAFIGEGSGDSSRPCLIVSSYNLGNLLTDSGATGNIGPEGFVYGIGVSNCYSTVSDVYGTALTNTEEAKSGELAVKLNNEPTYVAWKQTLGVHDHPVFDGEDVYGNLETGVFCNAILSANVYKHQIRFDKTTAGEYAGTFDFRAIVQINGLDSLCDSVEDIIDTSDGDGIVESGYILNKDAYIDAYYLNQQLIGVNKTYTQVDDAYISTTTISGGYASACLIQDIPDADKLSFVDMYYYIKYVYNGIPITLTCNVDTLGAFEILHSIYYPMAFPNA